MTAIVQPKRAKKHIAITCEAIWSNGVTAEKKVRIMIPKMKDENGANNISEYVNELWNVSVENCVQTAGVAISQYWKSITFTVEGENP